MASPIPIDDPLILLRGYQPSDEPIIMSSWVASARRNVRVLRRMRPTDYFRAMRRFIHALRARGAVLRVACYSGDPDYVVGWACVSQEPRAVHYVYVLQDYRGQGVARMLLAGFGDGTVYTCKGRKPAPAGWVFRPARVGGGE